ncbi:discoidin domain-containing receptor tyrosine kinase B-like [Amphibalanus amphitrite]|uniref:discoidin domain-containing receptor tyrosine kinase B-like n=2 Tax=Amphibalanus amphitrite TaxID=1232801 RepID=UPI001C928681|nr:discoidin domain-containing receptor tyrosine kinase B-like [Amphibalanus amphitrite]
MNMKRLLLLGLSMLVARSQALSLDQCDQALGMESGEIADSQLTVSSSFSDHIVGAHSARIRTEHRGGAWCPLQAITDQVHEYLQIDLGQVTVITAAETQGRFGNGRGMEWAERYELEYWRPGWDAETGWRTYRNVSGHTRLDGNVNSYMAAKTPLDPPLLAAKVRLVPRSSHPRTVCLRAELYGCRYTDGLVSYSMEPPDPSRPDLTYDGTGSAEVMEGGLGQLTDGRDGGNDITRPEWVGWKRRPGEKVTLTFQFDSVREMESASFHVSNHFTSGIRMFESAALFFSVDGSEFTSAPVTLTPPADRIFEDARRLEMRLYRQVGRVVRLELTTAASWLLISEISFDSAPSSHNVTGLTTVDESAPPVDSDSDSISDSADSADSAAEQPAVDPGFSAPSEGAGESAGGAEDAVDSPSSLTVLLVVLGVLLVLLPSALVGYVLLLGRRRRVAGGAAAAARPLPLPLARNIKELRLSMQLTPRHGYSRPPDSGEEDKLDLAAAAERYRVVRLNSEYNTPGHGRTEEPAETTYDYAVPVLTPAGPAAGSEGSRSWDNPNYRQSPHNTTHSSSQPSVCSISELLPSPPPLPPPPPQPPASTGWRSAAQRRPALLAGSVQGVTGTCVWDASREGLREDHQARLAVAEVDEHDIQLGERIGQGQYGQIRLCELQCRSPLDALYPGSRRLATARSLRRWAPADAAARLRQEAEPLCRVTDCHVTRLLGLCTLDEAPGLLVEHLEHGDLNEFLRRAHHDGARGEGQLGLDSLVYIASQIAAGMEHLESLGIVHGDLAARNCLVGRQLEVKVGDLGPSRKQYDSDYFSLPDGRVLPLRWRPPEALFTDELSSASDVWSFAVTLWEVLTWCRLQPLAHLTDSAVIERLAGYRSSYGEPHLQQPHACPALLYRLLLQCWRLQPAQRPSFAEVGSLFRETGGGWEMNESAEL